jgi:multimeric flavodoxin WrbA
MKVLGIVCSPRWQGNTETMVGHALAKAQQEGAEIELISLARKTISPCDGCRSCHSTGECHIEDDMQAIYGKLLEADGIIFGTPVYFWNVSAQAKALIDRTYAFSPARKLRNKAAGVVVTTERSGDTSTISLFNGFFTIQKMIMVGRTVGISGDEGYSDKEAVRGDKPGMAQAEALGEAMVEYLRSHQIPG